jgi:hypothetical protein
MVSVFAVDDVVVDELVLDAVTVTVTEAVTDPAEFPAVNV